MAQKGAHPGSVSVRGRSGGRRALPWGVVFTGVEGIPVHILDKCLKNADSLFRTGARLWTKLRQGGVHFQHQHALSLLGADLPHDLFGRNHPFRVSRYTGPFVATAFAPKMVSNEAILDAVVGCFRVRRWKNHSRGMTVLFSSERALAKAVRDGATIKGQIVEFEVARRRPCSRCMGLDHRVCDQPKKCSRCCSEEHLRAECKAEEPWCLHCQGNHYSRRCPELKAELIRLQQKDTETLLSKIPSFRELKNGECVDLPVAHLPPRQINMCKQKNVSEKDFKKRSFADVVSGKRKRRRKNKKKNKKKDKARQQQSQEQHAEARLVDVEEEKAEPMIEDDKAADNDAVQSMLMKILERLDSIEHRLQKLECEKKEGEDMDQDVDDCELDPTTAVLDRLHVIESRLYDFENAKKSKEAVLPAMSIRCGTCSAVFADEQQLNAHMQEKHRFRCEVCRVFTCGLKNEMQTHMYQNHVGCPVCHKAFVNEAAVYEHVARVHPEAVSQSNSNPSRKSSSTEAGRRQ